MDGPALVNPQSDIDSQAEAAAVLPVPQGLHTAVVFDHQAQAFTRMATRVVPDILYRAAGDMFGGDANSNADDARDERDNHVWMQGDNLSTDELNQRYGVEGVLRFNQPTTEADAAWRSQNAREELFKSQVFARTHPQPLMDFGAGLAGSLVDPAGAAVMLGTGGLGELAFGARAIEGAAEAGQAVSLLGRVANAARPVAVGALDNAPYVAANAALSNYVGDDYSLVDGLRDIAAGAIFHTTLHYAGEGLRAALGRARGPGLDAAADPDVPSEPLQPPPATDFAPASGVPDPVNDLPATSRRGAFVKAVSDLAEDRPVDVAGLVEQELTPPSASRLDELTAAPALPGFRPMEADTAVTPRGTRIPVQFGLAELDSLTTSHNDALQPNPNYPQELQPRDRARAGAQANNFRLEAQLDPKLLMRDTAAGGGAPIVAPDGVVESGNGRTIALRRSAAGGGEAYARYVAELKAQGFNTDGMQKPVLVRMRTQEMTGAARAALAREMNVSAVEKPPVLEQAQTDAARISPDSFDLIKSNTGPTTTPAFVRRFIADVAPEDVNSLVNAHGEPSPEGASRIKAAVLARAYGDPRLVAQIFEGETTAGRKLGEALAEAAPRWAQMRALAERGAIPRELDQTEALKETVDLVRRAAAGEHGVAALFDELRDQPDMFTGRVLDPNVEQFLRLFYTDEGFTRPRPAAEVAAGLRDYARQAMAVTPGPDIFGETAGEDTARQILANLNQRFASGDIGDLDAVRPPGKPDATGPAALERGDHGQGVRDAGEDGGGAGPGVSAAGEPGAGGEGERGAPAERLIAADPELKALRDDTEALAAEHGIEPEAAKPSQDPETISKATAALAQCLLDGAEEVL